MAALFLLAFLGAVIGGLALWARWMERYRDLENQLRQSRRQRQDVIDFLNHFSRSLATVADIDHGMQLVAHYLADVLRAESLAIFKLDTDPADNRRKLRGVAVSGLFPPLHRASDIVLAKPKYRLEHLRHEFIDFGEGVLGEAAETEQSILIQRAADYPEPDRLPPRVDTLIAVPMSIENQFVGLICAVNTREEQRVFTNDDLHMLEDLSYQAALAINLVTIYSERSKQARILQELQLGREIQQSLIPATVPEWGVYEFSAFNQPALEVGGDYYDFVPIDENRLMIIIADAAGKGVPACMLMAMCRSFVRSLIEQYAGLETFLEHLNRRLFRDTDHAHFVTMAAVVMDKENHVCEYGSAGHTGLLMNMPDGITRVINPEGPALGLLPPELGVTFDTLSFCFHEGTSLLLVTDGITESLNAEEEEFGIERLRSVWGEKGGSLKELEQGILTSVHAFAGKTPQADDQTLMIIRR